MQDDPAVPVQCRAVGLGQRVSHVQSLNTYSQSARREGKSEAGRRGSKEYLRLTTADIHSRQVTKAYLSPESRR